VVVVEEAVVEVAEGVIANMEVEVVVAEGVVQEQVVVRVVPEEQKLPIV